MRFRVLALLVVTLGFASKSSVAQQPSDPQDAVTYTERGMATASKGDLDGAIADFSQAIALNPKYTTAYYGRGVAKAEKGTSMARLRTSRRPSRLIPKTH